MEEWIKIIAPVIAPLVGIAALWWKLTTSMATKKDISELRSDMNRADDNLRADMGSLENNLRADMGSLENRLRADMGNLENRLRADMRNLEERLFTEISKLNDRMDRFDDRMGRFDDRMDKFNDRMDGLYDSHHTDIMKVLDKMDGVANDLRAEIRERIHDKADSVED